LGMEGYYQRFIHMFMAKPCPLAQLLWKDAPAPMEDVVLKHAFE
jgi:hypothetical protein